MRRILCGLVLAGFVALGDVLVDTYNGQRADWTANPTWLFMGDPGTYPTGYAVPFILDNGDGDRVFVEVTEVTLSVYGEDGGGNVVDDGLEVYIAQTAGSMPGAVVSDGTFIAANKALPGWTQGEHTLTLPSGSAPLLAEGDVYWLVAHVIDPNPSIFLWARGSVPGSSPFAIVYGESPITGYGFPSEPRGNLPAVILGGGYTEIPVPVPEPGALGLLALAGVLAAAVRRPRAI